MRLFLAYRCCIFPDKMILMRPRIHSIIPLEIRESEQEDKKVEQKRAIKLLTQSKPELQARFGVTLPGAVRIDGTGYCAKRQRY